MVSDMTDGSGMQQQEQTEIEAVRLARAIKGGSTNLLEVVETMGPALNSTKMVERLEALETLAQLLRELPTGLLVETEISSLLGYFIAQLKGHHPDSARIAIHALYTMFSRYTIPSGEAVVFVERFFNEAALVDLTRDDKMTLYRTFQLVFLNDSHLAAIAKQMSSGVLPGFLQLIELETDPQCLIICFNMFRSVVKNIPLGDYADDMFEYPAGYFPIDFNGSPDRHGGVTRAQLQDLLEECLMAHKHFSEHVIKLCLEKVSSDVHQAQIDSLRLLRRSIEQCDSSICSEYLEAIWPPLRKLHIVHGDDTQLQEGVLRTTTVLARRLSEADDGGVQLDRFAAIIWKDFEDRETFLEHSGWRFVVAYAGGSSKCSDKIIPKAFAKVTHMISDENQISSSLLDASSAMLQVVISLRQSAGSTQVSKTSIGTTIMPAVEMLVGQACALLLEPSCSSYLVKLIGLIRVALPIEDILGDSQLEIIRRFIELCIMQQFSNSMLPSTRTVPSVVLKSFIAACSTYYGHKFTSNLRELAKEHSCVWLLAGLVRNGDDSSLPHNNANDICSELFSIGGADAFAAIREIVLSHPAETVSSALEQLLSSQDLPAKDIEEYNDLLTVVVREASTHCGHSALQATLAGLHRQLSSSLRSVQCMPLLQLRVVLSNCPHNCLSDSFVTELTGTLLKLADIVKDDNEKNDDKITDDGSGWNLQTLTWQCVALLANKHLENSEAEWAIIGGVLGRCSGGSGDGSCVITNDHYNNDKMKQSVQNGIEAAYLAKGLLMRGHRRCEEVLAVALSNALNDIEAAKNFALIARAEPKIFPREGHCTVRLLYPQRLLTFAVPRLIEMFDKGNDSALSEVTDSFLASLTHQRSLILTERLNVSVAICSTIQYVSPDIAEPYLPKLGPIILWCLSQSTLPIECSRGLIQCLRRSLSQLKLNLDNVLPALLRWSQRPASMDLRIEAMACLLDLRTHFQIHELLPHKRKVLREMPVGDRKRLVRKAASTTALAWHMLGEVSR